MNEKDFIKKIHRRLAQTTIGSSALRNQGIGGLVKISREYLESSINLKTFFDTFTNETHFRQFLNEHTGKLLELYPEEGKSWGAARKSLNLFFRELIYNKFLADYFNLPTEFKEFNKTIEHLEVPLDRDVAEGIIENSNAPLLKWKSIKSLTLSISDNYQTKAKDIADKKQIARVHLDLLFWRPNPTASNYFF